MPLRGRERGEWGHPFENIPPVEFMYLLCTRMPGESYHR